MIDAFDASQFRPAVVERGPRCGGATDIGLVRRRNEDAFWISPDASALAVADGLGGLPAGDVASALAMAAVAEYLESAATGSSPAETDRDGVTTRLAGRARQAAAHAQRALAAAARRNPPLYGMATTLVLVLIDADVATVLHVGDSRAALWRRGHLARMTSDQNRAGDLVRQGTITLEQARVHPSRNLVREVVGHPEGFEAECQSWMLEAGDVLLLLTDGVTEAVSEQQITAVLSRATDASAAASTLVEMAAAGGGRDNATAIVRHVT